MNKIIGGKLILIIAILCLLMTLPSCSKTLYIAVMHPGDIDIPADVDTLLIIDNSIDQYTKKSKSENALGAVLSGSVTLNSVDKKDGIFETLTLLLKENSRFSLAQEEVLRVKRINYHVLMTDAEVDSLCTLFNADGVICLESIKDGIPNSTNTKPFAISNWRFIGQNGEIDNVSISAYGSVGSNEIYTLNKNAQRKYSPGEEASYQFMRRVTPSYYWEGRTYYHKGNEELKLAGEAIKSGNYAAAKNYMESIKDQKGLKNKVLKRLAHNLALLYEIEGEYETALMWAKRSLEKGNAPTIRYVSTLQKLVNEQPLIEFQLLRE